MKKKTTMIYEQERLLLHCQEAIADAIERSNVKRSEVAEELEKNKSFVTQALSSGRNLTLNSLASLLWASGYRLEPTLVSIAATEGALTASTETHKLHIVTCGESYEAAGSAQDGDGLEHEQNVFEAIG
jgi:hypothetical protein